MISMSDLGLRSPLTNALTLYVPAPIIMATEDPRQTALNKRYDLLAREFTSN